ncbi:MAG: o-succinylbenzoate synthase, partial [Acidimicrobiia bacterium]|nr:o-succinylbenzoate synthase [Acidimicrobiia bacterium]
MSERSGLIAGGELRRIALDLVTPFRTSFGEETARDVLLVAVDMEYGDVTVRGWGECVAMTAPLYSPEFV